MCRSLLQFGVSRCYIPSTSVRVHVSSPGSLWGWRINCGFTFVSTSKAFHPGHNLRSSHSGLMFQGLYDLLHHANCLPAQPILSRASWTAAMSDIAAQASAVHPVRTARLHPNLPPTNLQHVHATGSLHRRCGTPPAGPVWTARRATRIEAVHVLPNPPTATRGCPCSAHPSMRCQ